MKSRVRILKITNEHKEKPNKYEEIVNCQYQQIKDLQELLEKTMQTNKETINNLLPKVGNTIYLQIETNSISSQISSIDDNVLGVILSKPMCIFDDTIIVISHRENNMQELVGVGKIIN